jgi:hypothetical protein
MTTNNKTNPPSKTNSSENPNRSDGLKSLIGKLDNNPKAAEAMKQALAKTRAELKNSKTD